MKRSREVLTYLWRIPHRGQREAGGRGFVDDLKGRRCNAHLGTMWMRCDHGNNNTAPNPVEHSPVQAVSMAIPLSLMRLSGALFNLQASSIKCVVQRNMWLKLS
jgi:hypothetical protein